MNTKLLRMARRHSNGTRSWTIPGFGNALILTPRHLTMTGWGASVSWPARDAVGEMRRSVDLRRHRKLARLEIRRLLASL